MSPRARRIATTMGVSGVAEELGTALNTVASFQGAVQHADEKVRTVVAVQSTVTALVAAQLAFLLAAQPGYAVRTVVLAVLALFVAGYLYSAYELVQALRPRTDRPAGPNRFAFPTMAGAPHAIVPEPTRRQQCAEARELAALLADLAMVKHRHVRRALAGTCVLFGCSPLLLLMIGLS